MKVDKTAIARIAKGRCSLPKEGTVGASNIKYDEFPRISVTLTLTRSLTDTMMSLVYARVRKVTKVVMIDAFGFHLKLPRKGARHQ